MSESEMEKNENGVADATAEGPADEAAEVPESTVCVDEPTASTEAEPDASSSDPVKAGRMEASQNLVGDCQLRTQVGWTDFVPVPVEVVISMAAGVEFRWARQQLEERKRLREEREKLKQDSAAALPKKGLSGVTGLSLMEKQAAKFAKAEAEAESREPVNELAEAELPATEAGLAPSPLAESDAGEVTEPLPPPAEVEAEQEKASVDGMSQQLDEWMKRFNWSHRFFVLDPATSELSYYKNQGDKIPKGILLLGKDCKAFVQKHPKRDYVVAFNCPGRENFLINAERERLEEWGHALMSHLPNGITGMDEDGNFV
eukprot:gene11042-13062_t